MSRLSLSNCRIYLICQSPQPIPPPLNTLKSDHGLKLLFVDTFIWTALTERTQPVGARCWFEIFCCRGIIKDSLGIQSKAPVHATWLLESPQVVAVYTQRVQNVGTLVNRLLTLLHKSKLLFKN